MTRRVRRLILYSAILLFFLIAPAVIFYAWGYSFDWQNKKPVLTGGISLKTDPAKAEVFLNDKLQKQTPVFIKRLLPKTYQLKIIKEGFHAWQKKLKVEPGLVTEANEIILIPLSPQLELVKQGLTEDFLLKDFLPQEKTTDVFYIQEPSYILYRTDANQSFQEQINLTPLPAQKYEIIVSLNKKITLLSENKELFLLNPSTRNFDLISQNVQAAQFSQDNKKLLYFTADEIWVYYLENISSQPAKKAGEKELITRLSQKINQAVWYSQTNEHIIFAVGQSIKFTELDGRDQRNTVDIIEKEVSQIAYNSEDKKLYLVEKDKLWRLGLKQE